MERRTISLASTRQKLFEIRAGSRCSTPRNGRELLNHWGETAPEELLQIASLQTEAVREPFCRIPSMPNRAFAAIFEISQARDKNGRRKTLGPPAV